MGKTFRVAINGEEFSANRGDILLDAALMNGIDIPHDCRSGHCGTCRVRILEGRVFGGNATDAESAQACQCRIISDVHLAIEDVPEVTTTAARVASMQRLAPDVIEVAVEPIQPVVYLPGQYIQVRFRGFPARCYSPTVPLDRPGDDRTIRFQIRVLPDGRVSSALGRAIRPGHRVKLNGPFGSAYLRPGLLNRLVLVASGTGFAPIWSIAIAALREHPQRKLAVVVGAKTVDSLYMVSALCRLARYPNVTVIPCTDVAQKVTNVVRQGRPTDHIPPLSQGDLLYTCGAPPMVEAVAKMAKAAGARCYADPFVPNEQSDSGLLSRAMDWLTKEPTAMREAAPQKREKRPAQRSGRPSTQREMYPRQRTAGAGR
jgi:NAD(P)H-flavin reductase/ferredoxin